MAGGRPSGKRSTHPAGSPGLQVSASLPAVPSIRWDPTLTFLEVTLALTSRGCGMHVLAP